MNSKQNGRLEHEVEERHAHRRKWKDLARERHLLHEVRVVDHGPRPRLQRVREEVPREQSRQQEHREVGDRVAEDGDQEENTARKTTGFSRDQTAPRTDAVYFTFSSLRTMLTNTSRCARSSRSRATHVEARRLGGSLDGGSR